MTRTFNYITLDINVYWHIRLITKFIFITIETT